MIARQNDLCTCAWCKVSRTLSSLIKDNSLLSRANTEECHIKTRWTSNLAFTMRRNQRETSESYVTIGLIVMHYWWSAASIHWQRRLPPSPGSGFSVDCLLSIFIWFVLIPLLVLQRSDRQHSLCSLFVTCNDARRNNVFRLNVFSDTGGVTIYRLCIYKVCCIGFIVWYMRSNIDVCHLVIVMLISMIMKPAMMRLK